MKLFFCEIYIVMSKLEVRMEVIIILDDFKVWEMMLSIVFVFYGRNVSIVISIIR